MNTAATTDVRSHTDRRKARVAALQVLYEIDGARHDPGRVFESRSNESGLSRPSEEYARRLVEGFLENREEIDSTISTYAPTWPIRQIAMVDRNLLRLAVFEIVKDAETPPKVAINEAVEMAKIYGADNSPRFVNGVLGSILEAINSTEQQTSRRQTNGDS